MSIPDPCSLTGRRVVTVAEWFNRPRALVDAWAYWLVPETSEMIVVEAIAVREAYGDRYDLLFENGTYRLARGDELLYVCAQHYGAMK